MSVNEDARRATLRDRRGRLQEAVTATFPPDWTGEIVLVIDRGRLLKHSESRTIYHCSDDDERVTETCPR